MGYFIKKSNKKLNDSFIDRFKETFVKSIKEMEKKEIKKRKNEYNIFNQIRR